MSAVIMNALDPGDGVNGLRRSGHGPRMQDTFLECIFYF